MNVHRINPAQSEQTSNRAPLLAGSTAMPDLGSEAGWRPPRGTSVRQRGRLG